MCDENERLGRFGWAVVLIAWAILFCSAGWATWKLYTIFGHIG